MGEIKDYFCCEKCSNKDFKLVYNFSLNFHGVNFSDDLIYDKFVEEVYRCTQCDKAYTKAEIEAALNEVKRKRRKKG